MYKNMGMSIERAKNLMLYDKATIGDDVLRLVVFIAI